MIETIIKPKPSQESINKSPKESKHNISNPPSPHLYISILAMWIACVFWFHPRLISLLDMAIGPLSYVSLLFFILFIEFAWLYGLYNIGIIIFALIYRYFHTGRNIPVPSQIKGQEAAVAILYTVCNDFARKSAESCVKQAYPTFKVYVLDDSSDPTCKAEVDAFARDYADLVQVVRRPDRKAFKAGNMNHGLSRAAISEPYFAIADADEILPPDFLTKLVPIMENDPACGFIQANHRANPAQKGKLAKNLGIGIDLHWKWYQPLRNKYGFVMFLGHGAILRRTCWEEIGGFPDIVSEDLGFAIRIREKGYRGRFVEDVVCYEDFPEDVRSFRIRHMKWTRGTCEFLYKEAGALIKSKKITWMEKLDILFPTLNLPLTLLYLLFMINANLLMPALFGFEQILTLEIANQNLTIPITVLHAGFNSIFTWDFFLITLITFFAPVFCFLIGLIHKPLRLFQFLSHSTALYAALGPLSSIGVFSFLFTGKAIFLVTGDKNQQFESEKQGVGGKLKQSWKDLLTKSHPDHPVIQGIEVLIGCLFIWACIRLAQISFLGLCLAFILLPLMHHIRWENKIIRPILYLPFLLILLGLCLGGMSVLGMSTVFFGYGFHF